MARSPLYWNKFAGGLPYITDAHDGLGNVWFVNSGSSTTSTDGSSPDKPFPTIAAALDSTKVAAGDTILVASGHTESVTAAGGIDIDTAGIRLIGLGVGSKRPTITLGTATTADIDIDEQDILVRGFRFVSGIDSLGAPLDINSSFVTIENCEFRSSNTLECLTFCDLGTNPDDITFHGCVFIQPTDPAGSDGGAGTGGISLGGNSRVVVDGCRFYGFFETACIHNRTTGADMLFITNTVFYQSLSGAEIITCATGATGGMHSCFGVTPNAADVDEANVIGTLTAGFFVSRTCSFGNDGAGGQLAVHGALDAT